MYRVVQWATGNIGSRALQGVIDHPELSLAGVLVYGPEKAGLDGGQLCQRPDTGVRATSEPEEILALGADCVLYMPRAANIDDVCRLLASGANIVTTRSEFHHPGSLAPADRERIEAACVEGKSSIHSTGSSPGFITEAVPLVLASLQRRLDSLVIDEYADVSKRDSPAMLFEIMGFGQRPSDFDERRLGALKAAFGPSLRVTAEALGTPLDGFEVMGELALAPEDLTIAAGTVGQGTVAAQRITIAGMRNGRRFLVFRANWYCSTVLDQDWKLAASGWHLSVQGDVPMEVDVEFAVPLERMAALSPGFTANRAVNAVPAVCAAPPGIRTSVELPQLIARLG